MKKLKFTFWIFDPIFRKFDQKPLKSEKIQSFKKVIFDAKNVLLGRKLLLAAVFWPKSKEKTIFFKISKFLRTSDFFNISQNRDWLRGLPLKTVPTCYRRTWQCCSLKILSEPERVGLENIGEITLRYSTDSVIFVTFCQKVKLDIISNDQSATAKEMRKQLWATNTLITDPTPAPGHACPLGGRCFCIRYPVGRGRGPARF